MEKDIFHHGRIAKRIAARLALPNPPSQAVVGRLGAGKTTLLHLVRGHRRLMGADRRIRVVAAELWPYETSRAAVQGVIRTLVDELSKEVNVVGIRGIAAEYAEAMSAASGIWSALARLQGIPTNPNDALAVLDDVATAIGIRMVVWIEDLERFAGGPTGVGRRPGRDNDAVCAHR
jgi:ATPase subunit of ABC transporter with duplicated ATPase domains